MPLKRRECLAVLTGAVLALPLDDRSLAAAAPLTGGNRLPDASAFAPTDVTYFDNGSQHPIPLAGKAAVEAYLDKRTLLPASRDYQLNEEGPIEKFARLVNVAPEELTYVQSTTAGEQMVLRALNIPGSGGHIVTDTLHFFGSIPLYEEMARRGMEVTWLKPVDGRIRIADMAAAVRKGTRLVALSLVSTYNGFEHDLKAVCAIAHAHDALVYADIIHAAGCIPVDLKASGVDFAACASYKWLMGDFGLGFLYVRKDVLPRLKRANFGYYGLESLATHVYPLDPPGGSIADYRFRPDTGGSFALGTHSHTAIAQLNASLDYIAGLGVSAIQAHAQTIVDRLKHEVPKRGYPLLTPPETRTPVVSFLMSDARKHLAEPMKKAKVQITLTNSRLRLTPSVQNTMADVDRFLAALPKA